MFSLFIHKTKVIVLIEFYEEINNDNQLKQPIDLFNQ